MKNKDTIFLVLLLVLSVLNLALPIAGNTPVTLSEWDIEIVEHGGKLWDKSLVLDNNDYPHISYFNDSSYDLKYAYQDAGGWHIEDVDTASNVGEYNSLVLDSLGYPHISYRNITDGAVNYAFKNSSGWHIEVVDTEWDAGRWTSLALDSRGFPHIGYWMVDSGSKEHLKYAYMDIGGWVIIDVDTEGNSVGAYLSLVLDSSDYPHISYYDSTDDNLKYAYMNRWGWHLETVDSTGNVGEYTSIELDSDGYPHISYYDASNYDLKYAYKDVGGWQYIETVDNDGSVGRWNSLDLDTNNYPHISYYDASNYDLKYAYKDVGGWHLETVDTTGIVGEYTAIALDSMGHPRISYSYQDGLGHWGMKYAKLGTSNQPPNADFSYVPLNPSTQDMIQFIDCSSDIDGTIINWTWDFDDFNISYTQNPTHQYLVEGVYNVTLSVEDNDGLNDTKYQNIMVTQPLTTDFILITFGCSPNEIPNQSISTNFTFFCYASAFNNTHGFVGFVDVNWALINSGSNSSIDNTFGESVEFFSGWHDGTATLSIDDGSGHTDDATFTIDQSVFSMFIGCGWNLIGWWQDYDTDAPTLGQYIHSCKTVCRFKVETQMYQTHVVGIPYNEFTITRGMGLFVYSTEASIWDGTDGTP